jgi:ubiquinone/menaquinone biosynthesis C-methylase UbiE
MKIATMKFGDTMRQDWDERARKNAFYYIASWRKDWNENSFLQSGEEDYQNLVADILKRHVPPTFAVMLELGCGAGRMTRSFAQRFKRVVAFDISSKMLELAKSLHGEIDNITWTQGNGVDLSGVPSASMEFVFSYLVFQHLPSKALIRSYISEILRVLVEGGICLFQFNGTAEKNMNWKGRAAWGVVDLFWALRLKRASRYTAKMLGLDPEMAGKTWHGAGVKSEHVANIVGQSGGTVLELLGAETPMAWCCARKGSKSGESYGT